jgi:class 3 adenylate cyclase
LPGLEQIRAFMRGVVSSTPAFHLFGGQPTQASSGTAVVRQRISPWFDINGGFVDLTPLAEQVLTLTALTGAGPGVRARTVDLTLRYLRACTVEDEMVMARGRILHAGASFTTVEVLMEDALGRAVAHASGSVLLEIMEPPPPPLRDPLEPVVHPTYSTPDPPLRPVPARQRMNLAGGDVAALPPLADYLGVKVLSIGGGDATVAAEASEWFALYYPEVAPGIIAAIADAAQTAAISSYKEPDERLVIINASTSFLRALPADGRPMSATAAVAHRAGDVITTRAEVTDADGRPIAISHGPCMLRSSDGRATRRVTERVLLTVMFTDLASSTEQARAVGDDRWHDLLNDHHALIRRKLEQFKGREIKTTGDGFLCTFDSPTRAVQCAQAVRDGIGRLGLGIRIGVHTGECEVGGGDVSGVAVHVASRLESAAATGEVLVSSTVRDLIAGSGITLEPRGERELKGLGPVALFAVE